MKNREELERIIKKVCQKMQVALYDWRLKGRESNQSLVVYISKPNGVTLENCQQVSEKLSDELDMRDIFDSRYILQVSSPGLNRNLRTYQHFLDAKGEIVKIRYLSGDGNLKSVKGELIAVDENSISVKIENSENVKILYTQIKEARTAF